MAKFSKREDAILVIKYQGGQDAILYLIEEQVKNAELELLTAAPQTPDLSNRLVKSQTLRNLFEQLRRDLK